MEGVLKVSGPIGLWKVFGACLEGVWNVFRRCPDVGWKASGGKAFGRSLEKLYGTCMEGF